MIPRSATRLAGFAKLNEEKEKNREKTARVTIIIA